MSRRKCKSRVIPEQNKKICGSICLCQLIIVFSSVSLVYLTMVIYIPSHRAFNSGFEPIPVMCQTWNTTMQNNCNWASCGEWCLTKASGFCPQISAIVRRNGTDINLNDCTAVTAVSCPPANLDKMHRFNCNNGSECNALTGLFNCSLGHCANMSELFQCMYKTDGVHQIDSEKDNMKLNGYFHCNQSRCSKLKRLNPCDRYCKHIGTINGNVYLAYKDSVMTAQCKQVQATSACNGTEEGYPIPPATIWTAEPNQVLFVSCGSMQRFTNNNTIRATDCINGTISSYDDIPKPYMNFTTYWDIVRKSVQLLDTQQRFLPLQSFLTIYNNSRLYINLEGCVNTLQGECKQFLNTHGGDGKNQTAQSRFPCYYNKNNSFFVVARFNLTQVWRDLVIAISIPAVLFIISFLTLCIITQSVRVGDDTKMRCKYCLGKGNENNSIPKMISDEQPEQQTNTTL